MQSGPQKGRVAMWKSIASATILLACCLAARGTVFSPCYGCGRPHGCLANVCLWIDCSSDIPKHLAGCFTEPRVFMIAAGASARILHQFVPAQQQVAGGSQQDSAASQVQFTMHPLNWNHQWQKTGHCLYPSDVYIHSCKHSSERHGKDFSSQKSCNNILIRI